MPAKRKVSTGSEKSAKSAKTGVKELPDIKPEELDTSHVKIFQKWLTFDCTCKDGPP